MKEEGKRVREITSGQRREKNRGKGKGLNRPKQNGRGCKKQ